jgi:hypothetical protein
MQVVKREIAFSSSMKHDNIVRLLDVFAEGQTLVIVVRFSDPFGGSHEDRPGNAMSP